MRLKRKGFDEFSDDFYDLSLSSPALKSRRLDVNFPIVEEEEYKPVPRQQSSVVIEELPPEEEKAIVLFKPPLLDRIVPSPSSSFSVDSEFVAGIKSQILESNQGHYHDDGRFVEEEEEENCSESTEHLAVVPWVPSPVALDLHGPQVPELMEADEMGEATMDIEEDSSSSSSNNNNSSVETNNSYQLGVMPNGFPQWQQQHCMVPQLPQNTSTPITWFR